ncbi:tyrosine-type recombinase/integrase [Mesonia sp. K7]|uniref:tyrosine-type recombinase/integrase n=1 Tax=Mesonia sp. K7 TaxID=2218606 RepID=UPI000DAA212D|nr:tyrosine-type recombinase/integrase [Mesonia sp. K7]PZD78072.1 integrase [Mesonia sp. K7]
MSLLQRYCEYLLLEKKYSKHTVLAYENDILQFQTFIKRQFQEDLLEKVNYTLIRSWIIKLSEEGLSNKSINRKITSLKGFYKFLLKVKKIERSPLAQHKSLKVSKKISIPFSQTEIETVLNHIDRDSFENARDYLLVELLYATGMRREEIVNLQLSNFNSDFTQVKFLGKRNKERMVPIIKMIKPSIIHYLTYRKELLQDLEISSGHFFLTSKGKPIYPNLVYRRVNEFFKKVSTKTKTSPHILRHSFATHLLNQGVNLQEVKELLGHDSLVSTQVYIHNDIHSLKKVYQNSHPRNKD